MESTKSECVLRSGQGRHPTDLDAELKIGADKVERRLQEHAWEEVHTLAWWFRLTYNLSPKDPRYLEMTRVEIMQDWWAHQLHDKILEARKSGAKLATLDDALTFKPAHQEMSDEEFYQRVAEMDAEDDRIEAAKKAQLDVAPAPNERLDEEMPISFHADPSEA